MHNWNPGLRIPRTEFCPVLIGKSVLCGAESYGEPMQGPGFFVVSSLARGGFEGPVMPARVGAEMMRKDMVMENPPAD
jgi:hypothetical protein